MLSAVYYSLLATGLYVIYLFFCYVSQALTVKRLGFPSIQIPFMVQNGPFWMIAGPVSRPWLKRKLPQWLFNRYLAPTVYGLEFHQKDQPYQDYILPQTRANPKLRGGGKTYFLVTSGRLELWTWDAEIAKEVVTRPNDFRQFDIASIVMSVFGENVLTTNGKDWSRHRRIVAGAVTERVSSVVWDESVRQTKDLLASISKATKDTDGSESGVTHQMFDLIKRITIHVLYAAGMGNQQDFNSNEAGNGGDAPKPGMKFSYIDAVKIVNDNVSGSIVIPTSILLRWPSWLPGKQWAHDLGYAKVEFPQHTRDAVAREKQLEAQSGSARNNVMSALISASERNEADDGEKGNRRKGPALSDDELVGNLYIFTAAGFDTTANTISYALTLLARTPKWQDWVIEELDTLLPADGSGTFDYTSIFPKAHRTLSIMLETLRLFPPIIHVAKMTQSPQQVTTSTTGTFTIPAKTTVYVNNMLLHVDPAVWRNLNMSPLELAAAADDEDGIQGDEHDFRPSRWINPPGSASPIYQPAKGTYLPWSAGPRVCPGQKMAQVEFVGILATLFSQHRMEAIRKEVNVEGAPRVRIPESDDALKRRLEGLMENSTPKLTLEMDVYNIKEGEDRGLALRWVKRR